MTISNTSLTSGNTKESVRRHSKEGHSLPRKVSPEITEDGRKSPPFKELLTRETGEDKKPLIKSEAEEGKEIASLFDLAAKTSRKLQPQPQATSKHTSHNEKEGSFGGKKEMQKQESKIQASKIKDSKITPLTAASPALLAAGIAQIRAEAPKEVPRGANNVAMQLMEQMVAKLEKITAPTKVDTMITIKHPPLFDGVQIVVTEYSSSQKQFNVTFQGRIDPQARDLIVQKVNQEALRQALLEKGYTLQMITIEQKIPGLESTQIASEASQEGEDRKEKGSERDKQESSI
jgi:hypothetical protein